MYTVHTKNNTTNYNMDPPKNEFISKCKHIHTYYTYVNVYVYILGLERMFRQTVRNGISAEQGKELNLRNGMRNKNKSRNYHVYILTACSHMLRSNIFTFCMVFIHLDALLLSFAAALLLVPVLGFLTLAIYYRRRYSFGHDVCLVVGILLSHININICTIYKLLAV